MTIIDRLSIERHVDGPPHRAEMIPISRPGLQLAQLDERVGDFIVASKAPATLRAHRSDWQAFTTWCVHHSVNALPASPETLARYLTDLAGVKRSRRCSAASPASAKRTGPRATSHRHGRALCARRGGAFAARSALPRSGRRRCGLPSQGPGSHARHVAPRWHPGPGAARPRLCRCLPPQRAGGARRRQRRRDGRRPGGHDPAQQDGPGGRGRQHRPAVTAPTRRPEAP